MDFENLKNPELQEKPKSAKTVNELVALAKKEGLQPSDEQLEAVAGGDSYWDMMVGCEGQACNGYDCPVQECEYIPFGR